MATKSTRIYKPVEYGDLFEGSAKTEEYSPQIAYDNSKAIEEDTKRKLADVKTQADSAARQATLDNGILKAQHTVQKANLDAKWTTIKGVISLSGQAASLYGKLGEIDIQRKKDDEFLNSIGWGLEPEKDEKPLTEVEVEEQNNDDIQIEAESKGTSAVATELEESPDPTDKSTANQLRQGTTYNALAPHQNNIHNAAAAYPTFLSTAIQNIPESERPKTAAEAAVLLKELNRQFLRQNGLMDGRFRGQILDVLQPIVKTNTQLQLNSLVTTAIAAEQKDNLIKAKSFTNDLIKTFTTSDNNGLFDYDQKQAAATRLWKAVSNRYGFGNVGYSERGSASNEAALTYILDVASKMDGGDELIQALRITPGRFDVKGKPVKGTELQNNYSHLFEKAETDYKNEAINRFNRSESQQKIKFKETRDEYYNNHKVANKDKAISELFKIDTVESRALAAKLQQTGLGYDPNKVNELLELQLRGVDIDETLINHLLDEGIITVEEATTVRGSGPCRASKKVVQAEIKVLTDNGAISDALGNASETPEAERGNNFSWALASRVPAFTDELERLVMAEVRMNPGLAGNKTKLMEVIDEKKEFLTQQPRFKARTTATGRVQWGGELNDGTSTRSFETISNTSLSRGKAGVEDYTALSVDSINNPDLFSKGQMDPTRDFFLTKSQLQQGAEAYLNNNGDWRKNSRISKLAKSLGLSEAAFINAQARLYGIPNIRQIKNQQNLKPQFNFQNAREGFNYLRSDLEIPNRSAAFLAGSIQSQSAWGGERKFEGDDNVTQGGLASWTTFQNDPGRLGAIERYFGRGIADISERDQLKYMIKEMQTQYPEVYKVVMDPNSSDGDLKKAMLDFFGYTNVGNRFKHAETLLGGAVIN